MNKEVQVHFITGLGVGGAENMLLRFVRNSSQLQHIVFYFDRSAGMEPEFIKAGAMLIKIRSTVPGFLQGLARACLVLMQHRKRRSLSWMYHSNIFAALCALISFSSKPVLSVRGNYVALESYTYAFRFTLYANAILSHLGYRFVFNSERSLADAVKILRFREKNCIHIPNGFELSRVGFSTDLRTKARTDLNLHEKNVVTFLGRTHSVKQPELAIVVMGALRKISERFYFLGIGKGWRGAEMEEKIRANGILDSILRLDYVEDIKYYLNATDVLILTSKSEAFPNVVGEALGCGARVVSFDVGDVSDLISSSDGIIVGGVDEMVAAIRKMLDVDDSVDDKLDRSEIFLRRFCIEEMFKKYSHLLEKSK